VLTNMPKAKPCNSWKGSHAKQADNALAASVT